MTDLLAEHMAGILEQVKQATGIVHWVGSVGMGVCSTGREFLDQPAIEIMLGELVEDIFRVMCTERTVDVIPDDIKMGTSEAFPTVISKIIICRS